jgi:hypothetical protein
MGRAQGVPRWIRSDSGSFDPALGGRASMSAPRCCSQSAGSFRATSTNQLRLFEPEGLCHPGPVCRIGTRAIVDVPLLDM